MVGALREPPNYSCLVTHADCPFSVTSAALEKRKDKMSSLLKSFSVFPASRSLPKFSQFFSLNTKEVRSYEMLVTTYQYTRYHNMQVFIDAETNISSFSYSVSYTAALRLIVQPYDEDEDDDYFLSFS
jgi:hypothetical protein